MKSVSKCTPRCERVLLVTILIVSVFLGIGLVCKGAGISLDENSVIKEVSNYFNGMLDNVATQAMGHDAKGLLHQLASKQPEERLTAIDKMCQTVTFQLAKQVVPALVEAMQHDEYEAVRIEATRAISKFGVFAPDARAAMLRSLSDDLGVIRTLAAEYFIKVGKFIQDDLVRELKTDDPKRFAAVAMVLSQFGNTTLADQMPRLIELVRHQDSYVRSHIACALGQLRESSVIESLRGLLHDPEPQVRIYAVAAIEHAVPTTEQLVKLLSPLLQDEYAQIRLNVVQILGRIGDEDRSVVNILADHLKREKDPELIQFTSRMKRKLDTSMTKDAYQ